MATRNVLLAVVALSAAGAASSCNLLFPFNADQLGETRVKALCHFAFGCCTAIERQLFVNAPFKDEGACGAELLEDATLGFLLNIDALAKDAIDRQAAQFDAEAAERCTRPQLDAVNQCEVDKLVDGSGNFDFNRLIFLTDAGDPECLALAARNFTRGLVDDGDDCISDFDCKDFGSCLGDPDDVGEVVTSSGTCKALVGEGEDCSEAGCLPGLVCGGGGATPECAEIDPKADGETCFADGECESLNCADTIVGGTCLSDGAPCTADEQCDPDDFCSGEFSSACASADEKIVEICDGL